jgi:AAA+ superfamily predicted ATPase
MKPTRDEQSAMSRRRPSKPRSRSQTPRPKASKTGGPWTALKWLDDLLSRAIAAADATYGTGGTRDPFRGLHISEEDIARLLAREAGAPTLRSDVVDPIEGCRAAVSRDPRVTWLERSFGLSTFDLAVIMIALAPELDLRYERLYAYLQDDVTRRRPSVDVALNLLCATVDEKLARRAHFAPDAPLIQRDIVRFVSDPNNPDPPLLAKALILDEQIVRLLVGGNSLDRRLASFCELVEPDVSLEELPLGPGVQRTFKRLVADARHTGRPLKLYFHGPYGSGQTRAARAIAREARTRFVSTDLGRAPTTAPEFETAIGVLFREARLLDAVLFLDGVDAIRPDESPSRYGWLMNELAGAHTITILAGSRPWTPPQRASGTRGIGVVAVPFTIPMFDQRRACWDANLRLEGLEVDPDALESVADRYRLMPGQIEEAVSALRTLEHFGGGAADVDPAGAGTPRVSASTLFAAARLQTGHDLRTLARKIESHYTWSDIVLPQDSVTQLREICQRIVYSRRVLDEWGFGRKLSFGKGVSALFTGPSGTGKTMAAEILAGDLELDLYKIDLSHVVSKWIGETEKNLDRIFTAAENANAILFFDEADALFGKRSEVRDSHDRYANVEISYLLQKMEEYEGIAILATNLRANLDDAFVRRLAFTVHFPFPDEESRRRIWTGIWPAATPVADDADAAYLAKQFKLSGGHIKNIALAAAVLAAAEGGVVRLAHVLHATRREFQKLGKVLTENEIALRVEAQI